MEKGQKENLAIYVNKPFRHMICIYSQLYGQVMSPKLSGKICDLEAF